jgi:hypothetical protein
MLFVLEIECDNAAFETNRNVEVSRILYELVSKLTSEPEDTLNFGLRNSNGNLVGAAEFFPDR